MLIFVIEVNKVLEFFREVLYSGVLYFDNKDWLIDLGVASVIVIKYILSSLIL